MAEKIFFKDANGYKVCGILSEQDKNKPIVVMAHGLSSGKDSFTNISLEKMFNEKGFSTFRIDLFGHGESDGKFENLTVSNAAQSLLSTIDYVKEKGYLRIVLVGSSFSGICSIMAASKSDDLICLALKCPVSQYEKLEMERKGEQFIKEWKERGYYEYDSGFQGKLRLNYTLFEDFKNNDGWKAAEKIKIPTLIVHGDKDITVPISQSKTVCKIIKDCKLEVVEGADHFFRAKPEHFQEMLNLIFDFIIKNSK
ncbi:alpha/beta fold hydrolase [Candidatus Micrarchaeota archaeon]|nr:alpha/beta fold hydrolase [Candidatus Micrarchaeota archaeon]